MVDYFKKEALPGVFIVLAFCLGAFLLFSINPPGLVSSSFDMKVRFDSIAGLRENAAVWFAGVEKYQGIDIGTVKSIKIITTSSDDNKQEYKIEVTLNINKAIPVKQGAQFKIASKGLAGNPHVEIIPGNPDANDIPLDTVQTGVNPPQDVFETVQDLANQFKAIKLDILGKKLHKSMDNVVSITDKLNKTSSNVNDIVQQLKDKQDIDIILANVRTLSQKSITTVDKADVLLTNLNTTAGKVDCVVTENRENIKIMIANFTKLSGNLDENLSDTINKLNALITNMDAFLKENKEQINDIMVNLKATTQNAKLFTQDIKLNPWKLFMKNKEKKPQELEIQNDKGPVIK